MPDGPGGRLAPREQRRLGPDGPPPQPVERARIPAAGRRGSVESSRHDSGSARPRGAPRARQGRGGPAGAREAEDLLRRRGRSGQDLRDAGGGTDPASGGRRPGRRGRRDAQACGDRGAPRRPRDPAAPRRRVSGRLAQGIRPRRRASPPAVAGPGRRAGAHERPRQSARQALAGRPRAARGRHHRLHDPQRPAHREPQRRGGEDHGRGRAGNGARFGVRAGRRR